MVRIERTRDKYQRQIFKKEFIQELKSADNLPPEASFNNIKDMLEWLNGKETNATSDR